MARPRKAQTHFAARRQDAAEVEIVPTGAKAPEADPEWAAQIKAYWYALTESAAAPAYTAAEWQEVFLRFIGLDKCLRASKFSPNAWRETLDGIASVEKAVIARHRAGYTGKVAENKAPEESIDELQRLFNVPDRRPK